MILYQAPNLSDPAPCPYLPGQTMVQEDFFAGGIDEHELDTLLTRGWRKFGHSWFRPACPQCKKCIPVRIRTEDFYPSRSQKRVLRLGAELTVNFEPLRYTEDLFTLYQKHSHIRFQQAPSFDEFVTTLHHPSTPSLLARYTLRAQTIGVGYLDKSAQALNSTYFIFDPDYARLSPGIYSVLTEIAEAHRQERSYYYLGFFVPGSPRMAYKIRFSPCEYYDWKTGHWKADNLDNSG